MFHNERSQDFQSDFDHHSDQSSYLISSRASRRNLFSQADLTDECIDDFKQEIQTRYELTLANRIYCFPVGLEAYEVDPNEYHEYSDLTQNAEYNLRSQLPSTNSSTKTKNSTGSAFMRRDEAYRPSLKPTHNRVLSDTRQAKGDSDVSLILINSLDNQIAALQSLKDRILRTSVVEGRLSTLGREEPSQIMRRRLQTQPYEKQAGFLTKKK